jgi:hypothetical protein
MKRTDAEPVRGTVRVSFSTDLDREGGPMLSTVAVHRLRMLLAVVAGTVVLVLAVVALFLVISAMTAGPAASAGADWGAVY